MAHVPVVIIVPVLNRPHHVERLMANVAETTRRPHRLLFVADRGDRPELVALERAGADYIVVPRERRRYACKINDGIRASDEPLIFMAADDVRFHKAWLHLAAQRFIGPTDAIKVVGTNDGGINPRVKAGEHSVHTLLTREYAELGSIDDPEVVLHEGYPHEYCDDEFIGTAKFRDAFVSEPLSVVEHLHPYAGAPLDATYRRGWAGRAQGKRVIDRRRHLWESTSSSPRSGRRSTGAGR